MVRRVASYWPRSDRHPLLIIYSVSTGRWRPKNTLNNWSWNYQVRFCEVRSRSAFKPAYALKLQASFDHPNAEWRYE